MEDLVNELIDRWQKIIESIEVDGYTKPVESRQCFRMNKYYDKEDVIKWCYKVNYNFPMFGHRGRLGHINQELKPSDDKRVDQWHIELEKAFLKLFCDSECEATPQSNDAYGYTRSGETKFFNNKVDYMSDQGYRFIIQFYPEGFIPMIRSEKLEAIGI
jgi:hypothetical protein